jgi:hypothetical protein
MHCLFMSFSQPFFAIDYCFVMLNALLQSKMKVVSIKFSEFGEMRGWNQGSGAVLKEGKDVQSDGLIFTYVPKH